MRLVWVALAILFECGDAGKRSSRAAVGSSIFRSLAKQAGSEWVQHGGDDVPWDGALGTVLLAAVRLAVAPAIPLIAASGAVDLPWDDPPIRLAAGPAITGTANVTRFTLDGLSTIGPFELKAGGPGQVEACASFGSLASTALVNATIRSPLGPIKATLRATSVTQSCSATLVLRARLRKGALLRLASSFPPSADAVSSALSLEIDTVRARIAGDVRVRVEPVDGGGAPAALWGLLSSALQATLREMVEQQVQQKMLLELAKLGLYEAVGAEAVGAAVARADANSTAASGGGAAPQCAEKDEEEREADG